MYVTIIVMLVCKCDDCIIRIFSQQQLSAAFLVILVWHKMYPPFFVGVSDFKETDYCFAFIVLWMDMIPILNIATDKYTHTQNGLHNPSGAHTLKGQ